jgi:hypothetical protein
MLFICISSTAKNENLSMHDIEPHFKWRNEYCSTEDENLPFYGKEHSEFHFTNKVYNYFIHPQWDEFGSPTLYLKVIFADYPNGFAIIELIGEWNDAIHNDVMFLKREVIDHLIDAGISKFILICENVLNFHASDDCYYEEWSEDIADEMGWICLLNTLDHVEEEMRSQQIHYYVSMGPPYNNVNWRKLKPKNLCLLIEKMVEGMTPLLGEE